MSRYRLRIDADLDQCLAFSNWIQAHQFLSQRKERVLEIGSGMGEFLVHEAMQHPSLLFLGIELEWKRVLKATEKIWKQQNLENIRFLHAKADESLAQSLSDFDFQMIHINHPDPWSKRRHFKRRLIRPSMLTVFATLLTLQGTLWISTDHPEYAKSIHNDILSSENYQIIENQLLDEDALMQLGRKQTIFAEKLEAKGRPSRLLVARCIQKPTP